MINEQSETQYTRVARQAYLYALDKKMKPFDAWKKAAEEIITRQTTRDKGCPRATFIGLCESGDLVLSRQFICLNRLSIFLDLQSKIVNHANTKYKM